MKPAPARRFRPPRMLPPGPWACALTVLLLARASAWAELPGAGPASAPAGPERSEAAIVLEIQRLLEPDETIVQPDQRRRALVARLRRIPALVAALEREHPASRYRAAAYSMALDAWVRRREVGDAEATDARLASAARRLLAAARRPNLRAQARFVLLQVELLKVLPPVASQLASSPTATAPTTRRAGRLAAMAGKFIRLAEEFPGSIYAAPALFQAGAIYLETGRRRAAVGAFDRLVRDYPKDSYSLQALMILVRLHTQAGRADQALAAKRRCVEAFPDSPASRKYRADIARAECIGKPFFLRFRSARGRQVNARDYRGKVLLVYFYASLLERPAGQAVAREMAALEKFARGHSAVLLAVGVDRAEDAARVAAVLNAAKIDTPNLLDPEGKVASNYGVLFVPSVAIIGPDGRLKDIVTDTDIVPALRKALRGTATRPARP